MARPFALPFARARRGFGAADIALAALVVLVVGLMIVPLPTWTLDLLIATNLSAAVAILLVVLYVPDAIGIATFPTLLLLTTLFRLVAQRRLDAPHPAAGQRRARSSRRSARSSSAATTSSGAVVFLVLTIIQFIVIAKGSERVAEVGARFVARRDARQADGHRRRAPRRAPSTATRRGGAGACSSARASSTARWTAR